MFVGKVSPKKRGYTKTNVLMHPLEGICRLYLQKYSLVELSELVVRTKNFNDLVFIKLLHVVASWTEILTWVEFSGLFSEYLANSSGHSKTRV